MTTTYLLYGLNVASEFEIDAETISTGQPDIVITNDSFEMPEMLRGRTGMLYHVSNETIYLHWDTLGSFRIHAGSEITATPAKSGGGKLFLRSLTGSILAIALYQRQRFILHASAVVVNGEAVLFSGNSGYGKSTIASSLHACGHDLLADDIAAIQVGDSAHIVFPGNQEFKLWPDSIRNIGAEVEELHRISPDLEKRLIPVTDRLERKPVPLSRVYILDFGEKEGIEPLHPAQAAIELIRNTYAVTLLHDLRTVDFFQQVISLAKSVPVFRLQRRNSLEYFDAFLAMTQDHLAR